MGKKGKTIVTVTQRRPGVPAFEAAAALPPMARRLALLSAHTPEIMRAWSAVSIDFADPVVVVAKRSDAMGRLFWKKDAQLRGDTAIVLTSAAKFLAAIANIDAANPELTGGLRSIVPWKMYAAAIAYGGATAGYLGMRASTGQFIITNADDALGHGALTTVQLIRNDIEARNALVQKHAGDVATVGIALRDSGLLDPVVVVGDLRRYGLSDDPEARVIGGPLEGVRYALGDDLDQEAADDIRQAPRSWVKVVVIGALGTTAVAYTDRGPIMLGTH